VDPRQTLRFVEHEWEAAVVPMLKDYIRIPSKSPTFDQEWEAHGEIERALNLIVDWCRPRLPQGAHLSVERLPGRTPLLLIDVPGRGDDCVLLYGHYDKQPEFTGWRDGLGPWEPVLEGPRLYGRGGADDGYSTFTSLTALRALQEQGASHARCVMLIEGCEESGSFDLPFYLDVLADRIGRPSLVIGLDSGCGNYDQLWATTSLRGLIAGNLSVALLREGIHSGYGSGVVASSFRVLRQLLDRIEDPETGAIHPGFLHVEVPAERLEQAAHLASFLNEDFYASFPLLDGAQPVTRDVNELILNRTWRPTLSITGAAGLPPLESAGNVLRPYTAVKVSVRIPPTCDATAAQARLKELLEAAPPYGARVTFEPEAEAYGWNAPPTAPWLGAAIERASQDFYGREAAYMGEGGTIPFMAMLGQRFPEAQFLITGVLGPESNAHGPNEFLHVPMATRLTAVVAQVIAAHAESGVRG
jgi:acetylornithine deacetylase/succinyl-diaminopimelate desuccinylase-like protein